MQTLVTIVWLMAGMVVVAQANDDAKLSEVARLHKKAIFRATFNGSADAEMAKGDAKIYTAKSLERKKTVAGLQSKVVRVEAVGGKRNNALHFVGPTKELTFFKGGKNLPYQAEEFHGSVSLWMKLSPKEDLPKGYVDPLQITDKKWNDASFFIDFDQSEERPFRLGAFSDFKVWNPTNRKFDDIPMEERPMVPVTKWPFRGDRWTHVAFTWQHINSEKDAAIKLYIDGKLQGSIGGKQHFTWSRKNAVIMLGINYVGWLDDLMIFEQPLSEAEIQLLATN